MRGRTVGARAWVGLMLMLLLMAAVMQASEAREAVAVGSGTYVLALQVEKATALVDRMDGVVGDLASPSRLIAELDKSLIPDMAMSENEKAAARKKGDGEAEKPEEEAKPAQEAEVTSPPMTTPAPEATPEEAPPPVVEIVATPAPVASPAPAQVTEAQPYVPPKGRAEEVSPETAQERLLRQEVFQQTVTLSFKDANLQNVLRIISQKTGLNIIMSEKDVKGTVTVHLEDVPLGAALDSILKTNELSFVIEPGNIVRVVPRKEVRKKEIELKTVHRTINWVQAKRIKETLEPFLTEDGQIQACEDSNALIITDTPPNVAILEDLVAKLDIPEKQVMIEARLIDMSEGARRELGINWGLLKYEPERPGWTDQEQFTQVTFDPSLLRPGQLTISKLPHFFGETWALDMTLSAMENRNEIVVLANPKVITLNNVPATIDIVENLPYTEGVLSQGGQFVTEEVKFEETGIKMTVTPNITNNGFVRMMISPEQKILRRYVATRYGSVPQIDSRKSLTNVIVKDEETVVMGGLRKLQRSNDTTGVPWFHRIPLFGWLFKDNTTTADKLELVMFVTPHIIKEPVLAAEEQYRYDEIDYDWQLPDYFYDDVTVKK
jgi:type IV pilus assembly protein PilQ